ncbi:MAG: LD-carboxypeptidase [Candidatus Kapabacteria bacterium]|nr:LD-carboxypeptidase [Candidatus Kapabacteria bacterium]
MNRRDLLACTAVSLVAGCVPKIAGTALAGTQSTILPYLLKTGSTVGIISPGTAVSDPSDLAKITEVLDTLGLKAKFGKCFSNNSRGYKTKSAQERVDDIHDFFSDSSVSAIFCARGGYGSGILLDSIDYNLIKKNPKILLGYSDITALHLAINKLTGLVTFHGPVMMSPFTNFTFDNLKKALFTVSPIGKLMNPSSMSGIRKIYPTRSIIGGKAAGALIGGNLSLICSLMGTEYEIDTKRKILLIEDVDEEPFRMDRMLNQLRLAGKFKDAAGVIIGLCNGCEPKGSQSSTWDSSLGEILERIFNQYDKPVFYGLVFGHTSDQLTLPIGVKAEMNADEGSLTISEPCLID